MNPAKPPAPADTIKALPPDIEIETTDVLRASMRAARALADLNGRATSLPNPNILIDTLTLQEAKASSAIENIVTTQDELFQGIQNGNGTASPATKEVLRYCGALKLGHKCMMEHDGIITNNALIDMFRHLKSRSNEGFRVTPGTVIKNQSTGEVVHTPPQDAREIVALMTDLENFINADDRCALDPLIKMALIHHQFESIHPFSDGNGRIGRILNVLYLVRTGLLDAPILYLSRHIVRTKPDYYRLLQGIRSSGDSASAWREWVVYMLTAVEQTSRTTLSLVRGIRDQMAAMKTRMREKLPKMYSQRLLNNLFRHPYTKIDYVANELDVTRPTASRYLHALADEGLVVKERRGTSNYYINTALAQLLEDAAEE